MNEKSNASRIKGTIIRVLPNQGYCFIRGDDNLSRFGHARAFQDPLEFDRSREGQGVEFTPVTDTSKTARGGGLRAIQIVLLPAGYAVDKL